MCKKSQKKYKIKLDTHRFQRLGLLYTFLGWCG